MTDVLQDALILLILLQVKHLFADFYLQTPRMLAGRGEYLHLGRAQHVGVHAVGSIIVLMVMGTAMPALAIIVIAECIAHYHIDYGKGRHSEITGYTPADPGYWRAMGLDQALHQLTYVVMIWAWAVYG